MRSQIDCDISSVIYPIFMLKGMVMKKTNKGKQISDGQTQNKLLGDH